MRFSERGEQMAGKSKVEGITVVIGGNTSGLSKALSGINEEIKHTQSGLNSVNRLLKLDPKNTELLRQKQQLLAEKIGETKVKLDALRQAEVQMQQQVKEGKIAQEEYDKLKREIIATEQALKDLETEARNSNVVLSQIGEVGKKFQEAGDKISGVGADLTKSVTTPIAALGTLAVKTASDFDSAMSQVAAVSGATGAELEALRDKAREMGAKTKFSASEAAEAMNYMAMAGWKTEDMLGGIEGIMNLAAASGEDLATTSDIVTDALTAFGLSAEDSGHFADILASASSNANTNVGLMGETFKYVAPLAGSLGYSAEDTATAIGLMANAGIKGSQAGTSLRSVMTRLAKPTKESQTAMDALGLSITDSSGKMKPLSEIMDDMRKSFSGLTEEEKASYAAMLGGQEAMSGLLAIVNASDKDFEKLSSAINNASYNIDEISDALQKSGVQWEKYYNKAWKTGGSMDGVLDDVIYNLTQAGTSAKELQEYLQFEYDMDADDAVKTIEIVQEALESSKGAAEQMAEVMQDNLAGQLTILKSQMEELFISIGEVLMPVIRDIVTWIQGIVDKLNSMDEGTRNTIITIALLIAALGPVLMIIGNITSGIGGLLIVLSKMGPIVTGIGSVFSSVFSFIVANPIVLLIAAIVGLVALIATKGDEIQGILQKVDDFMQNIFAKDWAEVFPFLGNILNAFSANLKNIWDSIMLAMNGVIDFIRGVFTGDWERAWKGLKEIFGGIVGSLVAVMKAPLNGIIALVNGMIDGINWVIRKVNSLSFTNPFSGEKVGFHFGEIGKIPYLAKGGVLSQGSAVVGEAGPELLTVMGNRAIVQPLTNQTTNTSHLGGMTVHVYGAAGQDVRELADLVADKVQEAIERQEAVYA